MSRPSYLPVLAAALLLAGCEISRPEHKQDTTTVAPSATEAAADSARAAANAPGSGGVPAVPSDSGRGMATDSNAVLLFPAAPRRGDALFAFVPGVATDTPHCSWKGATLPCYRQGAGVLAVIPLPADEPAGTFTLTVEHPGGRIARQVTVADHDFGRELVFLDAPHYALVRRGADIARDARATRAVLASETPQRLWTGRWRDPVSPGKAPGYGAERFYYPATDSSRAISLDRSATTRGTFGTDTSVAAGSAVPSWRHAGVDLPARKGATVAAPADGQVADVGSYVLTGNTVVLDHGQGVLTAYFHLDTILVRRGDRVSAGKSLGRAGATGLATGPHLHYGIYVHGKDVDPASWLAMPTWLRTDSGSPPAPTTAASPASGTASTSTSAPAP